MRAEKAAAALQRSLAGRARAAPRRLLRCGTAPSQRPPPPRAGATSETAPAKKKKQSRRCPPPASKPKSVRKRSKHRMSVDYPRDVVDKENTTAPPAKARWPRCRSSSASRPVEDLLAAEEGARDDADARADARARGDDARAAPGRDDYVGGRPQRRGAGRPSPPNSTRRWRARAGRLLLLDGAGQPPPPGQLGSACYAGLLL